MTTHRLVRVELGVDGLAEELLKERTHLGDAGGAIVGIAPIGVALVSMAPWGCGSSHIRCSISKCGTLGMRVEPPTRTISSTSFFSMPASDSTC